MLEKIRRDVLLTFGDESSPSYFSVADRISRGYELYEIRDIVRRYWIMEVTDENEDYSFCFLIKGDGVDYRLELSVVGEYAVIFRIEGSACIICDPELLDGNNKLANSLAALRSKRMFLSAEILETKIPLSLENSSDGRFTNIYNALFSDSGSLPWTSKP